MDVPRFLHVANGTSATMTIEAAGIPGLCSIWADPLHDGPVPAGLTDAELVDVRSRHLDPSAEAGSLNDLNEWRRVIDEHESYDELILWYEHDLFDQLNLIQILPWIREHVPAAKIVSLISIDSFPGHPHFKGLGELMPHELASLIHLRQPVSDAQYTLAERAWCAFREPVPLTLDDLRRGDTAALPYLAAALTRFLEEFPSTTNGLSRTEQRLMHLAQPGSLSLAAAFPHMHTDERAYYVSDSSLLSVAEELSAVSPALMTLTTPTSGAHMLHRSIELTSTGQAVLRGELDRVVACDIDRWLGGVHLQRGVNMWRWDPARQGITAESSPF